MKPKTPAAGPRGDLDKLIDDLDDLSIHASAARIEVESASGAAATFLGLDSFQSKDSCSRSRLSLRNLATDLQEADILDSLLQLGGPPKDTARRGASGCLVSGDLMITSTLEGRLVHWKGMKPSDLLEAED
jgi:hypothetical protein